MHRLSHRLLTLALVVLFTLPAAAQFTRDTAATRKIDEAINTHYLATDFDKAEAVLTGTIKACEDKCSPPTLARAWMYVGIVRGSGRNDQAGAKEAFRTALGLDPSIKLDAGLATPETQATFGQSGGGAVETPATPAAPAGAAPAGGEAAEGSGLSCTPAVTEVETRRPIPVQCKSDEEVTSVELRYKAFGEETWKTLKMERKGKSFRGQIPCDATQTVGTLKLYVNGKDAQGETLVSWGSKTQPIEIQLAEESSEEAPSYEDADAPARCATKEICPPDFPGCDSGKGGGGTLDWGASCNNSTECKSGLLCMDGTCETAPSCTTTSDCPAGTCIAGKCAVSPDEDGTSGNTGPFKNWWVGLHVAQDFAFVGGDNVCLAESQASDNFACYFPNSTDTPYDPAHFGTTAVGKIGTGSVMATTRFLLSLDRAITANITAGVRLGYAIRGGPPAGRAVEYTGGDAMAKVLAEGKAFLPFHAEVRGAYWLGKNALAKRGLRPYVHAGGGMAQVDAKVVVNTHEECGRRSNANPPCSPEELDSTKPTPPNRGRTGDYSADAWKKLGQVFITIGGGAAYAFSPTMTAQLNLNAMYMLGASGLVLQPSLGLTFGL